jgi:hypothetical protein
VGTTNICELLLSVVNFNKPNVLIGLDQKVCGEEWSLNTGPPWTNHRRRREKGPHRSEIHAEQGKPKGRPGSGRRTARNADDSVGRGLREKAKAHL